MNKQECGFKIVYWEEVRESLHQVNKPLAELIDVISPDKHYPLIKARYQYGDLVVKNGTTYLPAVDRHPSLLPITDPCFKKTLKDHLTYSTIPLFLNLHKANEVYMNAHQRTVPLNLFYPGNLLGLFESLDLLYGRESAAAWSVSSGARHIFMLPKLNEQSGFKKLRIAYDIDPQQQPRFLTDHGLLFQAISRHKNFTQPWHNEILFFTQPWLLCAKKDPAWINFKEYLIGQAWHQAQFAISKIGFNLTWEHFAQAIAARHLKPIPYLVDQIKHVLLIALGRWPGFKTADTTDLVAPIQGLQRAIVEVYDLKKYLPTCLHISSLERDHEQPLYYSLSLPTLLEGLAHRNPESSTIMIDTRNIKQLMDTLLPAISQCSHSEIERLRSTRFEYFHVESDPYGEIVPSHTLPTLDPQLLTLQTQFPDRLFCSTSQFWRGCLRISHLPLN